MSIVCKANTQQIISSQRTSLQKILRSKIETCFDAQERGKLLKMLSEINDVRWSQRMIAAIRKRASEMHTLFGKIAPEKLSQDQLRRLEVRIVPVFESASFDLILTRRDDFTIWQQATLRADSRGVGCVVEARQCLLDIFRRLFPSRDYYVFARNVWRCVAFSMVSGTCPGDDHEKDLPASQKRLLLDNGDVHRVVQPDKAGVDDVLEGLVALEPFVNPAGDIADLGHLLHHDALAFSVGLVAR